MRKNRAKQAVSEVIGTAILLGMAIALFSVVQYIAFSFPFTPATPSVQLAGTIYSDPLNNKIVLIEHHGGESLSLDSKIIFRVTGYPDKGMVVRGNLTVATSNGNDLWEISENAYYNLTQHSIDITNRQVDITVIDVKSNSVVMMTTLQG